MLAVILKILSILGILLLVMLGLALVLMLLILFFPLTYKGDAEKDEEHLLINFRAKWLFGFLRIGYHYPEPGKFIVKVLWKTVYDSSTKKETDKQSAPEKKSLDSGEETTVREQTEAVQANEDASTEQEDIRAQEPVTEESETKTIPQKLFQKYEKIKYTIQQFYDKIRHIWDNIKFYKKLLQDEQTKLLFTHVLERLRKILRHVRPRKLRANVTFGTGSPDTTGYAYGIYGMFSPQLGKNVFVTPDFTQQIFVGNLYAAGHITVFTILINALAVLLDKRLSIFIRRLKNHSAKNSKVTK